AFGRPEPQGHRVFRLAGPTCETARDLILRETIDQNQIRSLLRDHPVSVRLPRAVIDFGAPGFLAWLDQPLVYCCSILPVEGEGAPIHVSWANYTSRLQHGLEGGSAAILQSGFSVQDGLILPKSNHAPRLQPIGISAGEA